MARGKLVFTPSFLSRLAPVFTRYVDLKRALGRRFEVPARTLQNLDRFLYAQDVKYPDLDDAAFQAWCHTHEHVASGVRRVRMLEVRAFCLYRRRSEPRCFIPDINSFPLYHQRIKPYIFRDAEIARLLRAASDMERCPASPLRPETIRLAIVLLYTTGIRRCELLNLRIGDHDRQDSTLHIHETKFYKSRLLPIHSGIADEIECYLSARGQRRFPAYPESALIWNPSWGGGAYSTTSLRRCIRSLLQECDIVTTKGSPPRIHDFRGYNRKSCDGQGNYNFGITDQSIFLEINIEKIKRTQGMNVTVVTSAKDDETCVDLLTMLGFPFEANKKEN